MFMGRDVSRSATVSVPMHYDGIVTNPAIYLDGELLEMEKYLGEPAGAQLA
jgi:leucyl aminopeptidase (aminopeptidase T)